MSTVGDRICACKRKHALLITQTVGLAASHEMLQTFSANTGRLTSHSTMEASMFTSMVRKLAGFRSLSWGVNKGAKICLLSFFFSTSLFTKGSNMGAAMSLQLQARRAALC